MPFAVQIVAVIRHFNILQNPQRHQHHTGNVIALGDQKRRKKKSKNHESKQYRLNWCERSAARSSSRAANLHSTRIITTLSKENTRSRSNNSSNYSKCSWVKSASFVTSPFRLFQLQKRSRTKLKSECERVKISRLFASGLASLPGCTYFSISIFLSSFSHFDPIKSRLACTKYSILVSN